MKWHYMVSKRAETLFHRLKSVEVRETKKLEAKRKELALLEDAMQKDNRDQEEIERLTWKERRDVGVLEKAVKKAQDERVEAEEIARKRYRDSVLIAREAAPYCHPKLASVERTGMPESTTEVNVNVTSLLAPYVGVLESLVGGKLGAEVGGVLPDSLAEPVDRGETDRASGDVPHDPMP